LTHSGRLTHEVVTRQPWIRRRSGKVRQLQTDVLTTEPRRQPAYKPVKFNVGFLQCSRHPTFRTRYDRNKIFSVLGSKFGQIDRRMAHMIIA